MPDDRVSPPSYAAQAALVKTMFPELGSLLQAGSEVDDVVRREVETLPERFVFGMTIFGSDLKLRMQRDGSRMVLLDPAKSPPPDLDIVFKHLGIAFLVMSFQESTALAFARGRMVVHGDTALAMRLVRCMDRAQAIMLPGPIAERALKAVPYLPGNERLPLVLRYFGAVARRAMQGN